MVIEGLIARYPLVICIGSGSAKLHRIRIKHWDGKGHGLGNGAAFMALEV